jgi:hypothetical protein
LYREELQNLYSKNIIQVRNPKRMRWAGCVLRMGEERSMYRVCMGKPEGTRALRKCRRRWENIKKGGEEIGWKNMDCPNLV